jgi:hypothetical protein
VGFLSSDLPRVALDFLPSFENVSFDALSLQAIVFRTVCCFALAYIAGYAPTAQILTLGALLLVSSAHLAERRERKQCIGVEKKKYTTPRLTNTLSKEARKRPILLGDGRAAVLLTQGKVSYIDEEDVGLVEGRLWYAWYHHGNWYARIRTRKPDGKPTTLRLHQLLTGFRYSQVDHLDGNGLNNSKENLRDGSLHNNKNRRKNTNNNSGFKGVYRDGCRKKFCAHIRVDSKHFYLGSYQTPVEAAKAYDAAAIKHHGAYARLNFPREDYE